MNKMKKTNAPIIDNTNIKIGKQDLFIAQPYKNNLKRLNVGQSLLIEKSFIEQRYAIETMNHVASCIRTNINRKGRFKVTSNHKVGITVTKIEEGQ